MPLKTANFSMRIEEKKKADAEALFRTLGMTLPQAVNMFISQSLLVGGLPFESRLPQYGQEAQMITAQDSEENTAESAQ